MAPFRWYSAPGEGSGAYTALAQSASNLSASTSWEITQPARANLLVFPHDDATGIKAEYYLAGFPENSQVVMGLYRLDDQGQGGRAVKRWQIATNRWGAYREAFLQIAGEDAGQYALIAQAGPAFNFPGIDVPVSVVDFFAYNAPLDEQYDAYSLYIGRNGAAAAWPQKRQPRRRRPKANPRLPLLSQANRRLRLLPQRPPPLHHGPGGRFLPLASPCQRTPASGPRLVPCRPALAPRLKGRWCVSSPRRCPEAPLRLCS